MMLQTAALLTALSQGNYLPPCSVLLEMVFLEQIVSFCF